MKVNISSLHFKSDVKLEEFIQDKTSKLSTHYEGVLGCDVTLRLDPAQNNENKIVEMKVMIPGNDLFSKKQARTFEEATDNAVDALRRQLQRHKAKVRGV
ncbi:MAG: HPF/RaiA family ribosome-associated protein [Bacteroidales bacterium]|jgi:putative sigma-54 modulation protein|nr:HPF/RaiA family ribosome-associated protein [Bacteroidales bacterium]NLM92438.1 HPF/RaiA family ribosome-associated protein [Bacteroidales bacterium]